MDAGILGWLKLFFPIFSPAMSIFLGRNKKQLEACIARLSVDDPYSNPEVRELLSKKADELGLQTSYGINVPTERFIEMKATSEGTGYRIEDINRARIFSTLENGSLNFEGKIAPYVFYWLKSIMILVMLIGMQKMSYQILLTAPVIQPYEFVLFLFSLSAISLLFWDWFTVQEKIAIRLGKRQADQNKKEQPKPNRRNNLESKANEPRFSRLRSWLKIKEKSSNSQTADLADS